MHHQARGVHLSVRVGDHPLYRLVFREIRAEGITPEAELDRRSITYRQ